MSLEHATDLGAGAQAQPSLLRLRPFVQVTTTPNGIHVRGWSAAFTVDGAAVGHLWQRLAPALTRGVWPAQLEDMASRPTAKRAIRRLVQEFRSHEMLVSVPDGWHADGSVAQRPSPAVIDWLEAMAPDPRAACDRIRRADVQVRGSGPLLDACVRALLAAGLPLPTELPEPPGADGSPVVLHVVADHTTAVCLGTGSDIGFVSPPSEPRTASLDGARIAARLQIRTGDDPPRPLAAFVAGVAAHRLVCAVAGLPETAGIDRATPPYPAVLVVRTSPLRASYHPWLLDGAARSATATSMTEPGILDTTLARLDAVSDDTLGVLAAAEPGDLPQLPAALAACRTDGGAIIGIGATTGAARLDAALRAAAQQLDPTGESRLVVAADHRHFNGMLLRRAVAAQPAGRAAVAVPESTLTADPIAQRWWRALTLRFGVAANASVHRLAAGVFVARIRAMDRQLGWAVESAPGSALAFAALGATADAQAHRAGFVGPQGASTTCGASPQPTTRYPAAVGPAGHPWSRQDADAAEHGLQRALRRLLPADQHPIDQHPRAVRYTGSGDLLEALSATGFAVGSAAGHPADQAAGRG